MGGACEHISKILQFPVIIPQGQLDNTFAQAGDHHIIAGAGYYINASASYSRASKCLVTKDIIAWYCHSRISLVTAQYHEVSDVF